MDKFGNPSPNTVKKKPQYSTNVLHANMKVPLLEGGHYQKIGAMWTLKHEISSPKFYEIFVEIKLI